MSTERRKRHVNKGWHEIEWVHDDFGPYASGKFLHAYFRFADDLPTLERMGLIETIDAYAQGFRTIASYNGSRMRADGIAVTEHRADRLIELDTRFRAAIDRVLSGGACVDFELPPVARIDRIKQLQALRRKRGPDAVA